MTADETTEALSALLSSAVLVFVGSGVAAVSKIVERVVIARFVSLEAYGEVAMGIAVLSMASILSLAGLTQGIPRYMARFDDEAAVRGVWATGLAISLALSLVTAAALYAFARPVAAALFDRPDAVGLLRSFVLAVPLVVGFRVGIGGVRGMENTIYRTYVADLFYPLVRIAAVAALLLAGVGLQAVGYAYVLAAGAAFLAVHVLLNRLHPLVGRVRAYPVELLLFSLPLVVSTVLAVLLTRTDTLMLGYFRTSAEVGLYEAAYPLANGMLIVLSAFGFLYLPLASRFDAEGDRDRLDSVYKLTTKWVYVATFPVFLTFVAFPGDVLAIVFRDAFAGGAAALVVLSVGFFTNAAAGRNRETISALGYTSFILAGNGLAFALNVAMNLALIPRYGVLGAAVSSAAAYVALNAFVYLVLRGKFGISPFSRWSRRTFLALPVALVPPAALLSQAATLTAVTLPALLVGAGLASVAVMVAVGGVQPEDAVAVEFLEDAVGVRVPLVRRFLPEAGDGLPEEGTGQ